MVQKLNIAVLLAGNLRTFEQTAPLLKKYLLNKYQSDVFIYTPNQLEHSNAAWHGMTGNGNKVSSQLSQDIIRKVNKLYKPKKFVISDQFKNVKTNGLWKYPRKLDSGVQSTPLTGAYQMFFNWKEVNKLWMGYARKNKKKYDFVVFIRPDVLLLEPLRLESYNQFFAFNNKSIVFFYGDGGIIQNKNMFAWLHSSSDRIIFAKPQVMAIFLNIFDHFDRYFKKAPRLPFPEWLACCFENQQSLYAIEQGLYPIFGKINHILKRADKTKDQIFIFFDRLHHPIKSMPPYYGHLRRHVYYLIIKERIKLWRHNMVQGLKHLPRSALHALVNIYLSSPPLYISWRFIKRNIFLKKPLKSYN